MNELIGKKNLTIALISLEKIEPLNSGNDIFLHVCESCNLFKHINQPQSIRSIRKSPADPSLRFYTSGTWKSNICLISQQKMCLHDFMSNQSWKFHVTLLHFFSLSRRAPKPDHVWEAGSLTDASFLPTGSLSGNKPNHD